MSSPALPGQPPDEPGSNSRGGNPPPQPGVMMSTKVAVALIVMGGCIALVALGYDPVALVEVIARPLLK
ncbi:hypothetical protein [Nonomuraea wenchangensis]|uniref:Uncharacterized protein n=1 Tax=Nonomuraea wenchangensis TaxID=568860 RepID=A0A1I0LUN7_9ACTN|nr:hypothetical protein [Nonomuraea wenchangensis]SEU46483.1 hypothetical protein SAMN05421811_12746 [Nonomuraea wenchangensis]